MEPEEPTERRKEIPFLEMLVISDPTSEALASQARKLSGSTPSHVARSEAEGKRGGEGEGGEGAGERERDDEEPVEESQRGGGEEKLEEAGYSFLEFLDLDSGETIGLEESEFDPAVEVKRTASSSSQSSTGTAASTEQQQRKDLSFLEFLDLADEFTDELPQQGAAAVGAPGDHKRSVSGDLEEKKKKKGDAATGGMFKAGKGLFHLVKKRSQGPGGSRDPKAPKSKSTTIVDALDLEKTGYVSSDDEDGAYDSDPEQKDLAGQGKTSFNKYAYALGLRKPAEQPEKLDGGSRLRYRLALEWASINKTAAGELKLAHLLAYTRQNNFMTLAVGDLKAAVSVVSTTPSKDSLTTKEEFYEFYKMIFMFSRKSEKAIFSKFSKNGSYFTPTEFVAFLRNGQCMEEPNEALEKLQQRVFGLYGTKNGLQFEGFLSYLYSPENEVYVHHDNPKLVYQDMTQPISNYFIASSHNTYLLGDQLSSRSSPVAYAKALRSGCRSVELDTWDGSDGEPMIYHGHTLTTSITFESAVKAIKENAFQASPYPVFLSIENHCSPPQQEKMATTLQTVLADQLFYLPKDDSKVSYSPEELKFKILVKNKTRDLDPTVPQALADLVSCIPVKRDSLAHAARDGQSHHIMSFNESKALKLCHLDGRKFVEANKKMVTRIYPKAVRVDSSNYNPIPFWNVGCQMVALNYQTLDSSKQVYDAKFKENGGCGYLLKPKYLREPGASSFSPNVVTKTEALLLSLKKNDDKKGLFDFKRVTLKILAGQHLPKPQKFTAFKKSMVEEGVAVAPCVRFSVHGLPMDEAVHTTPFADGNFNPQWNDSFVFDVGQPDMAMLRFELIYKGPGRVAHFTSPLQSLKLGYHYLWLTPVDETHATSLATLLIHLDVQTYFSENKDDITLSMSSQLKDLFEKSSKGSSGSLTNSPVPQSPSDPGSQYSQLLQKRRDMFKKAVSDVSGLRIAKIRGKSLSSFRKNKNKASSAKAESSNEAIPADKPGAVRKSYSSGTDSDDETTKNQARVQAKGVKPSIPVPLAPTSSVKSAPPPVKGRGRSLSLTGVDALVIEQALGGNLPPVAEALKHSPKNSQVDLFGGLDHAELARKKAIRSKESDAIHGKGRKRGPSVTQKEGEIPSREGSLQDLGRPNSMTQDE